LSNSIILCQSAIESSSNPEQIGFQGEVGLFQIKPATANSLGLGTFTVEQLKDPATNTRLATTHLRNLLSEFNGDVRTALGAYKQGPSVTKE
jgi:soluble lytic murein transglycosylase-like protein